MDIHNIFKNGQIMALMESLLPDFILGFAFFTSVAYAVLAKRFEAQRAAVTISAVLGLSLSTGLVWWEHVNGWSILDLGLIAISLLICVLGLVIYQSVRQMGGSLAGAGIAVGACLFVAEAMRLPIPLDPHLVQILIVIALLVGIILFFERHSNVSTSLRTATLEEKEALPNMSKLFRDRHLSEDLTKGLKKLSRKTKKGQDRPERVQDIAAQIKRMLPVQGYLTERLARLRAQAHQIRNGHIARLQETREALAGATTEIKKKAAANLAQRYKQAIGIDTRLEQLDKAAAETELRARRLTEFAAKQARNYDHQGLHQSLKQAERLQDHNSKLFKTINRTEKVLTNLIKKVIKEVKSHANQ